jgi:ABC-type nitrate/sulfonate/bicarbonate transport system permease component
MKVRLLQVAFFALLVGTWQALAAFALIDPFFFSRPSAIAAKIW